MLLLVWRLFDKPDIQGAGATMGIQWGIFGALLAAGALIVAGARVRAVHAPEPPNPAADDVGWVAAPQRERDRRPDRRPRDATAVTEMLRDRPVWEGEEPTTKLPDRSAGEDHAAARSAGSVRRADGAAVRGSLAGRDHAAARGSVRRADPAPAAPGRHPPLWDDDRRAERAPLRDRGDRFRSSPIGR